MKAISILRYLVYIFKAKKEWSKPKKTPVLLYDRLGCEVFFDYLDQTKIGILHTRGESINIYVLVKALLSGSINYVGYQREYLRHAGVEKIITFVDNSPPFYRLKNLLPGLTTIFVQNGTRSKMGDVFEHLKPDPEFKVDYMMVLGAAIGREYQKYIKGQVLSIGSIKNNSIKKDFSQTQKKSILFISQFRKLRSEGTQDRSFFRISPTCPVTHEGLLTSEIILLPFLGRYCQEKGYNLRICGLASTPESLEYKFFEEILAGHPWEFIPRSSPLSCYSLVDCSEIAISVDSTLGYEAFGRGKKTAFFAIREVSLNTDGRKFGWPVPLSDNGPFWTNEANHRQFRRVMDYITTVDDEGWEKMRSQYMPEMMVFDPGNKKFLELMQNLKIPLIES